ncbi:MAG: hypothetical protein LAQ69_37630 [Acidobacteriia bacterium]|nr:hypothetical protein [Terriglobia bacterium]
MSFLKKAWTAISIVGVAAAIYMLIQWRPKDQHPMTGGDDAPIVMAGGSMYIGTIGPKFKQDPHATNEAIHEDNTRYVASVDILGAQGSLLTLQKLKFNDGTPPIVPVKIDMTYCDSGCSLSVDDSVTIMFTPASPHGGELRLKNTDSGHAIGSDVNSNVWEHKPSSRKLASIMVTGQAQPFTCPEGKCLIVIHYVK